MNESLKRFALDLAETHRFKTIEGFRFMVEREYLKQLPPDVASHGETHFARHIGVGRCQLKTLLERHGLVVVKRQGRRPRRQRVES